MATFFDETNEENLGEKQKSRSRRSSFRKTISLITDSRRSSEDASDSPLAPGSSRHRRSFSFHRRASSSQNSVTETPQSPSQYYNDPEARLKLRMVTASPQNFDQVLEHGFPPMPVSKPQRRNEEKAAPNSRSRRRTLPSYSSTKDEDRNAIVDSSFLDNSSSHDSESDRDDVYTPTRAGREVRKLSRHGRSESGSAQTDLTFGSDGEEDISNSENSRPLTPQWKDGPNVSSMPTSPEHYSHKRQNQSRHRIRSNASSMEASLADTGSWPTGPREMTLRMTLTKPELRDTENEIRSADLQGYRNDHQLRRGDGKSTQIDNPSPRTYKRSTQDPLALEALPPMHDHSALASKERRHEKETAKEREKEKKKEREKEKKREKAKEKQKPPGKKKHEQESRSESKHNPPSKIYSLFQKSKN